MYFISNVMKSISKFTLYFKNINLKFTYACKKLRHFSLVLTLGLGFLHLSPYLEFNKVSTAFEPMNQMNLSYRVL